MIAGPTSGFISTYKMVKKNPGDAIVDCLSHELEFISSFVMLFLMQSYLPSRWPPELATCLNIVTAAAPPARDVYINIDPAKEARIKWAYQKQETENAKERLWMLKIDR